MNRFCNKKRQRINSTAGKKTQKRHAADSQRLLLTLPPKVIAKRTSRSPDLTSSGTPAFPGLLPVASLASVRITVAGAVTDSHRIPFSNNRSNDQAVTVTLSNNIQFPSYILSRALWLVNIKSALSPNSLGFNAKHTVIQTNIWRPVGLISKQVLGIGVHAREDPPRYTAGRPPSQSLRRIHRTHLFGLRDFTIYFCRMK